MKVAHMTATATIHGLTWGCFSGVDGILVCFYDAKEEAQAGSAAAARVWGIREPGANRRVIRATDALFGHLGVVCKRERGPCGWAAGQHGAP
jgi:hypothetical protein